MYNGELYNTDELKEMRAESGGLRLPARESDTEVLLGLLLLLQGKMRRKAERYLCVRRSKAETAHRLFLCRDRVGVKPLFYHSYPNGLVFGSEIKAILNSGRVKPTVTEEGLT